MKVAYMGSAWGCGHGWRNMFRIKRDILGFTKDGDLFSGYVVSLLGFTFFVYGRDA